MTEKEEIKYACHLTDEAEFSRLASNKSKWVRMVVAVMTNSQDTLWSLRNDEHLNTRCFVAMKLTSIDRLKEMWETEKNDVVLTIINDTIEELEQSAVRK